MSLSKNRNLARHKNYSAVQGAAYRGARDLWNERTGTLHKYSWREDVLESGIVLPQAVAAEPDFQWAQDPYFLWNTVEFSENRQEARVARDYLMILPAPLSEDRRREAVFTFAQILADRQGTAVDVALHAPRTGRSPHFHAHLFTPIRQLGPEGLLDRTHFDATWSERRKWGIVQTYWQQHQELYEIWEHTIKSAIEKAGLEPHVYEMLKGSARGYRREYQQGLLEAGFDLKEQQRQDRLKMRLTPEEERQKAEKKRDIRRYWRMLEEARKEHRAQYQRDRRAGLLKPGDRYKLVCLPRWDVWRGVLSPWEVERQRRGRGETPGMVPWQAKESPQAEPDFLPQDEYDPRAAYTRQEQTLVQEPRALTNEQHASRELHPPRPQLENRPPAKAVEPEKNIPDPENTPIPGDPIMQKPDDGRQVPSQSARLMEHSQPPHEDELEAQRQRGAEALAPQPNVEQVLQPAQRARESESERQRTHTSEWNRQGRERFALLMGYTSAQAHEAALAAQRELKNKQKAAEREAQRHPQSIPEAAHEPQLKKLERQPLSESAQRNRIQSHRFALLMGYASIEAHEKALAEQKKQEQEKTLHREREHDHGMGL